MRCIANLSQIDAAKEEWRADHPDLAMSRDPTWDDMNVYLSDIWKNMKCPCGGIYILGRIDEEPQCTYSRSFSHEGLRYRHSLRPVRDSDSTATDHW